jgi:hypothetical protein
VGRRDDAGVRHQDQWDVLVGEVLAQATSSFVSVDDLQAAVLQTHPAHLRHRLESVKFLPHKGSNDRDLYGAITARSVDRPEIQAGRRSHRYENRCPSRSATPSARQPANLCSAETRHFAGPSQKELVQEPDPGSGERDLGLLHSGTPLHNWQGQRGIGVRNLPIEAGQFMTAGNRGGDECLRKGFVWEPPASWLRARGCVQVAPSAWQRAGTTSFCEHRSYVVEVRGTTGRRAWPRPQTSSTPKGPTSAVKGRKH